jgi:hypothetical protein
MNEHAETPLADPGEIRRTKPDYILHDPTGGQARRWDDETFFWLNEQSVVVETADGGLLGTWTSERLEPHRLRVMASRSEDGGRSWSEPLGIDGDGLEGGDRDGCTSAWQVPVVAPSGRVYLFYTHAASPLAGAFGGGLRCRCSDDHGRSFGPPADLPFARSPIDSPLEGRPPIWISIAAPVYDAQGRALLGFTRWAGEGTEPCARSENIKTRHSHIELMRIENIADAPEPADVEIRFLNVENPVTAEHEDDASLSFAQEPYLAFLPDGRLFLAMRTNRGEAWCALSEDGGESFRPAEPMRPQDNAAPFQQCVSPCPIFQVGEGEYVFLFNNNDGYVFGADSRWDARNRRPAYLCRGRYDATQSQGIRWDEPQLFIDNDAVGWGPAGLERLEAATYPSLTRRGGETVLWYPDRKGFLLGRTLP